MQFYEYKVKSKRESFYIMVNIIKLKELGFDTENIPVVSTQSSSCEHIIHHMLSGYKKFNEDYIHLLSDHASHVLGVEDQEEFRKHLLQISQDGEKDDALHCALSILSIHHRKKHHSEKGHGVSFPEAHRIMISFLENATPEKVQELHDRFPHVTRDVLESVAPAELLEQLSA